MHDPDRTEIIERLKAIAAHPSSRSSEEIREAIGWAVRELEAPPKRRKPKPSTACDGQLTIHDALADAG
jgi:hypothetical protein